MKTLVVGGNFSQFYADNRSSGVVERLVISLLEKKQDVTMMNGGYVDFLKKAAENSKDFDLVVWMPNVENQYPKIYPEKRQGSVLIVSKVDRGGDGDVEAISRIFKMGGNAVIKIKGVYDSNNYSIYSYKLIDALGNCWYEGNVIDNLAKAINELYFWTKGSVRKSLEHDDSVVRLLDINHKLADKYSKTYGRFFGNCSTRCKLLFPSTRFLFSKRNVNKKFIELSDMILVEKGVYYSKDKPSVDAPVQIAIYEQRPRINFMIHGHGFIKGKRYTEHYYPCGDLREVGDFCSIVPKYGYKNQEYNDVLNLKQHGFIMYATYISDMERMADTIEFEEVGK